MSQTAIILMMAFGWGLLLVVLLTQAFLATLLVRENRRLQVAASVHERLTSLSASLAGLRKEHALQCELVETYISRENVRAGRAKRGYQKKGEEPEEPLLEESVQDGIFFPTIAARSK